MPSQGYDYIVFIGRFQPYHAGHHAVVQKALRIADRVIMVLGSSDRPREPRNPFHYNERCDIICSALGTDNHRVDIIPTFDFTYNDDRWRSSVETGVYRVINKNFSPGPRKIGLIGYEKDTTSYYLTQFPHWEFIRHTDSLDNLDATELRQELYEDNELTRKWFTNNIHRITIESYKQQPWFDDIVAEYDYYKKYKESWAFSPFPPQFVTVDAVARSGENILLVQRKGRPGKGLWALPGGFVNPDETIRNAVIRELREETGLVANDVGRCEVFDNIHRSNRGRVISHTFLINFMNGICPVVKAADDAADARWIPIPQVANMRSQMFEDHYSIIDKMIGFANHAQYYS